MKGLLLKDWYAAKSYLYAFLWLSGLFVLAPVVIEGNMFFLIYPCLLPGMMTSSLIAYEEKEHWDAYAMTLPYTRCQMVSAKYIITLLANGAILAGILLVQTGLMLSRSAFCAASLWTLSFILVPISLIPPALLFPFVYKFGSEKSRLAYYAVLGVGCAVIGLLDGFFGKEPSLPDRFQTGLWLPLISLVLFILSWRLSVRLYEKRTF